MSSELQQYNLGEKEKIIVEAQSCLLANPVPIIRLSKSFGIAAVKKRTFDKNVSGQIRLVDGDYVIETNKAEPRTRRRFTIAHELAHFLLHKDKIGNGITENTLYRSGLPTQYEVEANRLAADILMPNEKIQEYIDIHGTDQVTIESLAKAFDVSVAAITVRLGIPSVTNAL